ncbi:MAG: hypothetical protein GY898_11560 [Proteobacteria bacterium]|nr:hypothetical protein [Pseudomonadota bacterium]
MRGLVIALAALCAVPMTGCATARKAPVPSASQMLVVAGDADSAASAQAREASAARALSTVPLRAYPGEADADLLAALGEGAASERVARARDEAEDLRVPWLLVLEEDGARIEAARAGDVVWRSRGRRFDDARVAVSLERAMTGKVAGAVPRLAGSERLAPARSALARGDWEVWKPLVEALAAEFPADPAVRTHAAFGPVLMGHAGAEAGLALPVEMAPDSESELLAIAIAAEDAGSMALASKAWDELVRLFPHRLDYHLGRSNILDDLQEPEEALRACRAGLRAADRDAILGIAKGTAPDQAPQALPFADLAFCVGYFLFEAEKWELAALAYEDAITLYEATDRFGELGEALNNAGVAMVQAERPLIGARTLRKAVDVRIELGYRLPLANSRYNLGRALDEAGKPAAARISLDRAAGDYRAAGEVYESLETLIETLDLHVQQEDRDGFETRAQEILELTAEEETTERIEALEGDTWFELGRGRLEFGDAEGSLAAYFRSLRVWQALGKKLEEGQTRYSMALPHLAMLELEESWLDLVGALQISVDLGDSGSIIAIRVQLDQLRDLFEQAGQEPPAIPEPLQRWVEPPGR